MASRPQIIHQTWRVAARGFVDRISQNLVAKAVHTTCRHDAWHVAPQVGSQGHDQVLGPVIDGRVDGLGNEEYRREHLPHSLPMAAQCTTRKRTIRHRELRGPVLPGPEPAYYFTAAFKAGGVRLTALSTAAAIMDRSSRSRCRGFCI